MPLPHDRAKGTTHWFSEWGLQPTVSESLRNCGMQMTRPQLDLSNQSSECVFTGPWMIPTSTAVWEPGVHLISQFLFSLECQLLEEEDFNPALSLPVTLGRSRQIVGPYCKFRKFDQKTCFSFLLFYCFVYSKLHQTGFI